MNLIRGVRSACAAACRRDRVANMAFFFFGGEREQLEMWPIWCSDSCLQQVCVLQIELVESWCEIEVTRQGGLVEQ